MLLYITLGTSDLDRARRFYDAVMPTLGLTFVHADDTEFGFSRPGEARTRFWVTKPFDGNPATIGNGSLVALEAESRAAVDAFYHAALAHDGTDEGGPGLRPYHAHFYACYVRDPDGNKLSAVCERPE